MKPIRLDKYLTEISGATRSEVKGWIKKGRVMVGDQKEKDPGRKVTEEDLVTLDGQTLSHSNFHYLMLHKPAGVVSATKDNIDRTVLDLVMEQDWGTEPFGMKVYQDVFPVGRLDKDTEGLLILTDDGDLAHRLLSPKKHVEKCYFALLDGEIREEDILSFEKGLDIGDEKLTMPAGLRKATEEESKRETPAGREGYGVFVTLKEGRFHQVKRMAQAIGREVLYLKRISMGALQLDPELPAGICRELSQEEIQKLS